MNTAEDPHAELAALRELLAAITRASVVPLPASEGNPDDMRKFYLECANRLNYLRLLAGIPFGASALLIRSNAAALTRLAAEPLPYQAETEGEQP